MDTPMSGITLAQAQAQLDALLAAQAGSTLTVRYGDRSVTYRQADEIARQITYWSRIIAELQRRAVGMSRHGYSAANLSGRG
jgi:hypothetical protein